MRTQFPLPIRVLFVELCYPRGTVDQVTYQFFIVTPASGIMVEAGSARAYLLPVVAGHPLLVCLSDTFRSEGAAVMVSRSITSLARRVRHLCSRPPVIFAGG